MIGDVSVLLRAMCSNGGEGKVLDIRQQGGALSDGANVQLYDATDPISQQWVIVPVDMQQFRIVPLAAMTLSLTSCGSVDGSSTGNTSTCRGAFTILVRQMSTVRMRR